MSILEKIFNRKKQVPEPTVPAIVDPIGDPPKDPNLIQIFDKYGRKLFIAKDDWRTQVLPGTIQSNWTKPDELYRIILDALRDGFRSDVVHAAQQLYKIDTNPVRAACIWAIVLMEVNRLDDAEQVLRDCIAQHGDDGAILTNLAKVYANRNDDDQSEKILWHALEVDPNQENAFAWYAAMYRERGGEAASLTAMRRVASLPGSWRAQLWLAREALTTRDFAAALSRYRESLARVAKPVPSDVLMQMSGDLGDSGHLREILQLVEPHFDVAFHGLDVGNNLIKAHVDLRQFEQASQILNQLYALNRPDYKEYLGYWDTEIAKARLAKIDEKDQLKLAMFTIGGPVWLKPDSPARDLFPPTSVDGPIICFLGSSATFARSHEQVELQLSNAQGRLSRALPLFLAEQVELTCYVSAQTFVPWIEKPGSGFVLSGKAWNDSDAIKYATKSSDNCDYVVITHLTESTNSWTASLRLVRIRDCRRVGELSESFAMEAPGDIALSFARQLLKLLQNTAAIKPQPLPPAYTVVTSAAMPNYLLRLEQLLATRCGAMDGTPKSQLSGEREILDGNIEQCLNYPQSISMRLLLAQTLLAMKQVRPDVLPEFAERIRLLQTEHSLVESAQKIVQELCDKAFET